MWHDLLHVLATVISIMLSLDKPTVLDITADDIVYYRVITIIHNDTRKYHEFVALYKCEAQAAMLKATNE